MICIASVFLSFLAVLVLGNQGPIPSSLVDPPGGLDVDVDQGPIPGYRVVDIIWTLDPFDNGTTVNLTGTVQQVYAKLLDINSDFILKEQNHTIGFDDDAMKDSPYRVICSGGPNGWQTASHYYIEDGIQYLARIGGTPHLEPGACGRVSCSYYSAIYWCNDGRFNAHLDSFRQIAECAAPVLQQCPPGQNVWSRCVGQVFVDAGDWNCIVRGDYDNC